MIAGVVLAAGSSSRFGGPKLLAALDGTPVVRWSVESLVEAGVDDVVVVLGRDSAEVRAALAGLRVRFVTNPVYAQGMSTSLRAGAEALGNVVSAAVVALGDQPRVGAAVVRALCEGYRASRKPIVVAVYQGVPGHPVLVDASLFAELIAATGDEGALGVVGRDAARVHGVEFPFAMPADVDTREDLERLRGSGSAARPAP